MSTTKEPVMDSPTPVRHSGHTMHIGATRPYMLRVIAEADWWRECLPGFDGTREEALEILKDDPRDVFCGCDCPKSEEPGDVGACLGTHAVA